MLYCRSDCFLRFGSGWWGGVVSKNAVCSDIYIYIASGMLRYLQMKCILFFWCLSNSRQCRFLCTFLLLMSHQYDWGHQGHAESAAKSSGPTTSIWCWQSVARSNRPGKSLFWLLSIFLLTIAKDIKCSYVRARENSVLFVSALLHAMSFPLFLPYGCTLGR